MPNDADIRRRIKAARELADLTVTELAQKIGSERLGAKALGSLERGDRKTAPQPHELAAIAAACDLPPEFFTVDFSRLPEISGPLPETEHDRERAIANFLATQDRTSAEQTAALATIMEKISVLSAEVERLRQERGEVTRSEDDERRQPPGALGRDARGSTPSSQHPEPAGSGRERDVR